MTAACVKCTAVCRADCTKLLRYILWALLNALKLWNNLVLVFMCLRLKPRHLGLLQHMSVSGVLSFTHPHFSSITQHDGTYREPLIWICFFLCQIAEQSLKLVAFHFHYFCSSLLGPSLNVRILQLEQSCGWRLPNRASPPIETCDLVLQTQSLEKPCAAWLLFSAADAHVFGMYAYVSVIM